MFLYRPHIHARDDIVTTPDIVVEAWAGPEGRRPIALLRNAGAADVAGCVVAPALVLVAGSYGPIATLGLELRAADRVALGLVAREAWRYADMAPHLGRIELALNAPGGIALRTALAAPASLPRRAEMIFVPAGPALTTPGRAGRFAVAATDPVLGRSLEFVVTGR